MHALAPLPSNRHTARRPCGPIVARTALLLVSALLASADLGRAQDAALSVDGAVRYSDGTSQVRVIHGIAPVPDSGQSTCWDASGNQRDCKGTGEDGEHRAGLSRVSPRFLDNLDGSVTDQQTGLVWMKDADCDWGTRTWQAALDTAADFNLGSSSAGGDCAEYDDDAPPHTDWRLPSLLELRSLIDFAAVVPALPLLHPFLDVPSTEFWTSTSTAASQSAAWIVDLGSGLALPANKGNPRRVWLVRGAPTVPGTPSSLSAEAALTLADAGLRFADGSLQHSAAVDHAPLRASGWTTCFDSSGQMRTCAGTGEDGELSNGVAPPTPRFSDQGDGTVLDHLTGLVWLQDADCTAGEKTWQQSLDWVSDLNTMSIGCTGYAAGTYDDWRLPNARELFSLIDFTEETPALSLGHPFVDVNGQIDDHYWSSTTVLGVSKTLAVATDMGDGAQRIKTKTDGSCCFVWPVRGSAIAASAQDASLSLGSGGIRFPDGSVQSSALAHRSAVRETGQTGCFATDGTPRACAGTGEDGQHRAGVAWPTPRFVDHGDGTVTDRLTGLIWLQDADCGDPPIVSWSNWQAILDWVDDFNAGSTGCAGYASGTYGDWRLPNVRELESVVDYGQSDPALPAGHPFVNVPWDEDAQVGTFSSFFMSSSAGPANPESDFLWTVSSRDGSVDLRFANGLENPGAQAIWPVRGSTHGPARVQDTGVRSDNCYATGGILMPCPGTGQDGELQAGVSWPTPRFTDHGDGTVTDELTGLMWLKQRDCLSGGLTWQQSLDSVTAFNDTAVGCTEYAPQTYTDWRMANNTELLSLHNYGSGDRLGGESPFLQAVVGDIAYCSSSSFVGVPSESWRLHHQFYRGDKSAAVCRAWPVRGGAE
jgi:hypothetical protein